MLRLAFALALVGAVISTSLACDSRTRRQTINKRIRGSEGLSGRSAVLNKLTENKACLPLAAIVANMQAEGEGPHQVYIADQDLGSVDFNGSRDRVAFTSAGDELSRARFFLTGEHKLRAETVAGRDLTRTSMVANLLSVVNQARDCANVTFQSASGRPAVFTTIGRSNISLRLMNQQDGEIRTYLLGRRDRLFVEVYTRVAPLICGARGQDLYMKRLYVIGYDRALGRVHLKREYANLLAQFVQLPEDVARQLVGGSDTAAADAEAERQERATQRRNTPARGKAGENGESVARPAPGEMSRQNATSISFETYNAIADLVARGQVVNSLTCKP